MGGWHTGPDYHAIYCPQDGQRHTLAEAVALNEKDTEFRIAKFHESMRRWRES